MSSRCSSLTAAAALFTTVLAAQPLTQSEKRGKQVVDDAIAALGGQKFVTMQDRIESGRAYSFYRDAISGLSLAKIFTRYIPVPEGKTGEVLGVQEREAFGKNEEYGYVLFREDNAWEVTYRGPSQMEAERYERYRLTTMNDLFYILRVRLHEPGLTFESRGSDVVDNIPVETVDIIDSQNRAVTAYFHSITKLPVREQWVWRDPKTKERNEEITRFTLYQDAGGIQWPAQIQRERNGEKIYQIFSESIETNQHLSDEVFAVPTGPAGKAPVKSKKK
jgi:hypothetical protein